MGQLKHLLRDRARKWLGPMILGGLDWSHFWHDTPHEWRSGQVMACTPTGEPVLRRRRKKQNIDLASFKSILALSKYKECKHMGFANTKSLQTDMFGRMERNSNAYKPLADTCCKIFDAEVVTVEIRLAVVVLLCPRGAAFGQRGWTRLYLVRVFCSMDSITFRCDAIATEGPTCRPVEAFEH